MMTSQEKSITVQIVAIVPVVLLAPIIAASLAKTVSVNTLAMVPLVILGVLKCTLCGDIRQFDLKSGIFYGLLVGLFLSLVSRLGMALQYFVLSESKDIAVLPKIIFDYWVAHLAFAVFGAVCLYFRMKIHIKRSQVQQGQGK